ncbi:M20 family metallo-hydrolase [Megasphaera paucivorans]|uniref:Allantoate deiminase n=1 Tax=Megasphaera paucivorans TaxID=349095 RepID=A0A1G9V8V8_9FIRM|nr:M20 family metallo-hydrolase [Megasphaera paucivorans]SDM68599.1 allantoate deiminase [Megasphaera paucivorans]
MTNTIVSDNLEKMLQDMMKFSADTTGVTRLPFTKEAEQAALYLQFRMREIGLESYIDVSGAVHGIHRGKTKKRIIIGSHYDSVKCGGPFDGIAGIVCGIETARLLADQELDYTLEIIALNDEEGIRFDGSYFSSKAFLGGWTVSDLKTIRDKNGISIYDAMNSMSLDPEHIADTAWNLDEIRCFLEVHIEQGPILDQKKCDLGIVDRIVGLRRYEITLCGQANHAGTTPMLMRHDPLAAAAKIISAVEEAALQHSDAVATVGFCKIVPNTINTIASQATLTIDIRSRNMIDITEISSKIASEVKQEALLRGVTYNLKETFCSEPAEMNPQLQKYLQSAISKSNYTYMTMSSGAGHDAQPISHKVPTAMLFIPSKDGKSHCPEEYTAVESLVKAVHVLQKTILIINKEVRC